MRTLLMLTLALWCAGCSEYGYRFHPHPQDPLNLVFLDYKIHDDVVDILVDTNGMRLQTIYAVNKATMRVDPKSVTYPPFEDEMMTSGGYLIHGPSLAQGPTIAHFDKASLGPAPWEVHLDVQGLKPSIASVGP